MTEIYYIYLPSDAKKIYQEFILHAITLQHDKTARDAEEIVQGETVITFAKHCIPEHLR